MGFLDKAKKLAEQAIDKAGDAITTLQEQRATNADASPPAPAGPAPVASSGDRDPRWGTAYEPGMLGRPGWREQGLVDPAAILPIRDRDRAGVPRSTKSEILEQAYGMGRRWTAGDRSLGLLYQLYPEHQAWAPPSGTAPLAGVAGAEAAELPNGRSIVFVSGAGKRVVLESAGVDEATRAELARIVAEQLTTA